MSSLLCLSLLAAPLGPLTPTGSGGPAAPPKEAQTAEPFLGDFYIEYMRGKSLPTSSDLRLKYGNNDFRYHDVQLGDRSFEPDGGVIPNYFFRKLGEGEFRDAIAALTDVYYGLRVYYFFRSAPDWGLGIDFLHFKVYVDDLDQRVRKTGSVAGVQTDTDVRIGDEMHSFNVSHGINHLHLAIVYRRRFMASKARPDGLFQPFLSAGFGPAIPHVELFFKDAQGGPVMQADSFQLETSNLGFFVGTGLRMRLHRHWAFVMEYKFSYSYLKGMRFDVVDRSEIDLDFSDHHFMWGFAIVI